MTDGSDEAAPAAPRPVRVRREATLCETPWFAVVRQSIVHADGAVGTACTVEYAAPAVGMIARRDGQVLLIRQYRFTVDEWVWAIPSGGVDSGETPMQAAMRELEEETGYRALEARLLLDYYPSYGSGNQRFLIYETDAVEHTGRPFDPHEVHEVRWFPREVVLRMALENRIVDGLSLTPLLLLFLQEAMDAGGEPPPVR
ncbi:MAG TPA: NUDIX hydrolase [Longimicrobiaceae bacterium]|nr:NUDIX hydrolase [Longimicrobiaceae bacterium]